MSPSKIIRIVGRIDAAAFFVIWSCVLALSSGHPSGALPLMIFVLIPLSAFVGWRGAKNAEKILNGLVGYYQIAKEGATSGVLLVILFFVFNSVLPKVFAAGNVLDGFSSGNAAHWFALFMTVIMPLSLLGAFLGCAHAVLIQWLNITLIERWFKK